MTLDFLEIPTFEERPISNAPTLAASLCKILNPFQPISLFKTLEFNENFFISDNKAFN